MKRWNFRVILKEIAIALVLLFIISSVLSYIRKPSLPTHGMPNVEITLLDGTIFKVDDDKPLVIHFWATWCPTCKLEAPNIDYISQKYKEYSVLTVAVNSGTNEEVKAYIDNRKFKFRVINDENASLAKEFKIRAYPTTLIYNRGILRFSEAGYTTTAGLLARLNLL